MYLADGAIKSALEKRVRALHALYYEVVDFGEHSFMLKLTDFVLVIKCFSHGCSNAIIWGLTAPRSMIDPDDAVIAIRALRNAASALSDQVDAHCVQTASFSQVRSGSEEDRERFWRALDVSDDILEEIVFVDPYWDGHKLIVNAELEGDPLVWSRLRAIVLYMFRFFYISETRWGKVGKSARFLLRALCVGLDNVVDLCKAGGTCSMENLNGFYRATPAVREYYICAGTSSRPCEALVLELLQDDRFLRRVPS